MAAMVAPTTTLSSIGRGRASKAHSLSPRDPALGISDFPRLRLESFVGLKLEQGRTLVSEWISTVKIDTSMHYCSKFKMSGKKST